MVPSDGSSDYLIALRHRRNRRVPYVNQACIECKRKKIKCDGVNPCAACTRNSVTCQYHPQRRVLGTPKLSSNVSKTVSTHTRSSQSPGQETSPVLESGPNLMSCDASSNSPEFCGPSSSEFTFGVVKGNLEAMGIPPSILDKSTPKTNPASNTPSQLAQYGPLMKILARDPLWEISLEDATNHIREWFSGTGFLYAVVSEEQLLKVASNVFDTLRAVNVHETRGRGTLAECLFHSDTNKLKLILATCLTLESGNCNDLAQRLFQSATEAGEGLLWGKNSISNIQMLVLMALYYYHLDEEVRTGRIIGFAARLCLEMGLHRRASVDRFTNSEEQAAGLQTFWCVYMLERRTSLGQGIPFYIQDCHVDPTLLAMNGHDPVMTALLDWTKLAGKTWYALNSQVEKESELNIDKIDYLDYRIEQWYQLLADDLKLEPIQPGQEVRHVQAVLFLRKSHLHNLICRPVLQSGTRITQYQRHAHKAVAVAKESLQMLSGLNENTAIIKRNPLFFKHLLLTAFGNLLLAVVNASSMFCDKVTVEFDIALDMIRALSNRSTLLLTLWERLQGLRKLTTRLSASSATASTSSGQGEQRDRVESPSDALLFGNMGDMMVFDQLNGFFDLTPMSTNSLPNMGSPFPMETLAGYTSRTVPFKVTSDITINADVVYPEKSDGSPAVVLLHYHGGFLIVGDRYSFLPHWLVHASASRGWVFVTPEYRLMPESTAHDSVEDAADAYKWALSSLPEIIGRPVGSILVGGSSAGGYLALNTAVSAAQKPSALLLIYGMLDPSGSRYTTPGKNIFGRPPVETGPILEKWPMAKASGEERKPVSAYPISGDPSADPRFALTSALHIDALFPDYMTGVSGLTRQIATQGAAAVPKEHQLLFPLDFGDFSGFPPVMLLHGANDSAVPVECSTRAAEKLKASGVRVLAEFPSDAEHGFDGRSGNVNVETSAGDSVTAVESLRKAIGFLEQHAAK
ncbi:hypothetical protein CPAR01_09285 [Colletotrichum paranaense]|uniref:Zn(2)-C6 fungal-type domain-containing protein n=1 Tax=Colletotrichum paranaense TaxID=1914294 RepID=A0ABQ9SGD7_9PEZI|nr:uncharacterized protein CPAR01_09285 [Colletotrichum paranaense]KAK1535743.1 hypothetical protein CPAR01_09285 [Colletotrichum paranaense]